MSPTSYGKWGMGKFAFMKAIISQWFVDQCFCIRTDWKAYWIVGRPRPEYFDF